MTARISFRLVWALVIAVLLGSAYLIVERNGAPMSTDGAPAYSH